MTADRFAPFGTTIFTEMTLLANKHGAVNLAQGFPDFDGPTFIKQAAAEAMAAGHNQYARMFGIPPLNQAIANWWKEQTGVEINPDTHVTVTSGCTEAIAATLLGIINPGDEVILFEPYYDSYLASVAMAGGVPRVVTLRAPDEPGGDRSGEGFWFDPEELRKAITGRTRAILLNTPHNPTGKVFSRAELNLIADLCIKHNITAITDEVYERLTYDGAQHLRLAAIDGMADRTVTLSSLGKSFSLTGWKVGWAIAAPPLSRAIRAAHQFLTFATSTPFQHGAAAALGRTNEREAAIADLLRDLSWGREFLSQALTELGFKVFVPRGAYFVMTDWTRAAGDKAMRWEDDAAFCKGLTAEAGVAAIPPSVFYTNKHHGRRLARFAFCKKRATLEEGVRRLRLWAGAGPG